MTKQGQRTRYVMDLFKAGLDSQGDNFTPAALEKVVKAFKGNMPVTIGFARGADPVGIATELSIGDGQIRAVVELDDVGANAVKKGFELAAGGTIANCDHRQDPPRLIDDFTLDQICLTDEKVK